MRFEPTILEHAAGMIRKRTWTVSRDEQLMLEAHLAAYKVYQHSPIIVGIDIYNIEAEAYGAITKDSGGNEVPSINSPLVHDIAEMIGIPPFNPLSDGRIPMVLNVAEKLSILCPTAQVLVPISGPFSIIANLLGLEKLLCAVLEEPDMLSRILESIVSGQENYCRAAEALKLPVIIFESAASPPLLSPKLFKEILLFHLKSLIKTASDINGKPAACIIGGNTLDIIELIMEANPGYVICPYETNQKLFMNKMEAYPDTVVRVNMDQRVFEAERDFKDVRKEADRVLRIAEKRKTAVIGSGILPYNACTESVINTKEYIEIESSHTKII